METMQTTGIVDNKTSSFYQRIFTDAADPRSNDWFLLSSPIPLALILLSYIYFVKVFGPKYMKNKKPFELKTILRVYNLFQIGFNAWIFVEIFHTSRNYNLICEPIDYSDSPQAIKAATLVYWYFLNKISDLLDTVFFTLRKKQQQISFLHVFHHTLMPVAAWIATKYVPGGHGPTVVGFLNSFIHILLYLYYYLASFGPEVQKFLWWKKYITKLQMIQFGLISIHNSLILFIECDYPIWSAWTVLPNAIFFFYLFADFYKKSYMRPEEKIQHNIQNGTSNKVKTQ